MTTIPDFQYFRNRMMAYEWATANEFKYKRARIGVSIYSNGHSTLEISEHSAALYAPAHLYKNGTKKSERLRWKRTFPETTAA